MPERRSLSNALELTPEKMAFIEGRATGQPAPTSPRSPTRVASSPTVPAPSPAERHPEEPPDDGAVPNQRPRRMSRPPRQVEDDSTPLVDHLLVPVTTRLHPRTANALRRAHLEQKLARRKPATQQEIVEAALSDWLARKGFIEAS